MDTIAVPTGGHLLVTRFDRQIDWKHSDNAQTNFDGRLASAFLFNKWCSDVSFYIPSEDQTIPAHAFIVAPASPVLERFCFDTDGVPNVDKQFTMPDYCTSEAIGIVLRYLYSGIKPTINETNALSVLMMADFLDLRNLRNHCCDLIFVKLSAENVCPVFNQIRFLQIDLNERCLELMDKNANALMRKGTALEMSAEALKSFLSRDSAHIANEFDLVEPFVKWADAECASRNIEVSGPNRRLVLGERVNLIRFAAMEQHQFMECTRLFGQDFFTANEVLATAQHIYCREKTLVCSYVSQFNSFPRTALQILNEEIELSENFLLKHSNTLHLDLSNESETYALIGLTFIKSNDTAMVIRNLNDFRYIQTYINSNSPSSVMFLQAVYPNKEGKIMLQMFQEDKGAFYTQKVLSSWHNNVKNKNSCVLRLHSKE